MSYLAALWTDGQVFTGSTHGDAYSKLTSDQKERTLLSGFWNPATGQFRTDDAEFYSKSVVLVRHSLVDNGSDPILTNLGLILAEYTANHLSTGLKNSKGFHSPANRCRQTAHIFATCLKFEFSQHHAIQDCCEEESSEEFCTRLRKFVDEIPDHSIVITHADCIIHIAQMLTGQPDLHLIAPAWDGTIPECSVTVVARRNLDFIGTVIA
jgi:broad specificity phosphatase PhoE